MGRQYHQDRPCLYDFLQGDGLAVVASVMPLFIMTDARQAKDNVLSRPPPAALPLLIPGPTDESRSS